MPFTPIPEARSSEEAVTSSSSEDGSLGRGSPPPPPGSAPAVPPVAPEPPRPQQYTFGNPSNPLPGPVRRKCGDELVTQPRGRLLGDGGACSRALALVRLIATVGLAGGLVFGMAYAYAEGYTLAHDEAYVLAIGVYGAFLFGHMALQYAFAGLEHFSQIRRDRRGRRADHGARTVALQVSAFQEDPDYLRACLESIKRLRYPRENLKVLVCIDGNGDDSLYMRDTFEAVFSDEKTGFFRWDYNFHELPEGVDDARNGVDLLKETVARHRVTCIMQKWGGKREVMYTAFKILDSLVDYVQVCDSDTILDPEATDELARVLDEEPGTGAVGGDVRILNEGDSFVSFLSSLRYWMAFNVERACQSYFGCVSCISGPLGMYRNARLQEFLDLWADQKFLGSVCTFGDDRHLTNRMLQHGHATKYTGYAVCSTETPAEYLRWLAQQIRWSKSFFREWLFNALWWHKHSVWMVYESMVSGVFPFFVIGTVVSMFWSGRLWNIVFVLLSVQAIGLLKGAFASLIRRSPIMIFMSLYSCLYMTSLLPAKLFAMATVTKKGWGTSGRKTLVTRYNALIPVVVWAAVLLPGLVYTSVVDIEGSIDDPGGHRIELGYLLWGFVIYLGYWVLLVGFWRCAVRGSLVRKEDLSVAGPVDPKLPGADASRVGRKSSSDALRGGPPRATARRKSSAHYLEPDFEHADDLAQYIEPDGRVGPLPRTRNGSYQAASPAMLRRLSNTPAGRARLSSSGSTGRERWYLDPPAGGRMVDEFDHAVDLLGAAGAAARRDTSGSVFSAGRGLAYRFSTAEAVPRSVIGSTSSSLGEEFTV